MTRMSSPAVCRLLGVDGGGTSTEAWLADADGHVVGRGKAGPSNAKAVGPAAARQALELAIGLAFEDARLPRSPVEVACLGMAGFDRPDDRALLKTWANESAWARRLVPVNDGDIVLAAGTSGGWGAGVIAGTGSIAIGRAADGRTARSGGWGPLLGDEGSAYEVVVNALRWVARRADGREPGLANADAEPDPLAARICAALGVDRTSEIVTAIYAPGMDRARIAALAPEVVAVCARCEDATRRLLVPAGKALAEMVAAVARSLGWHAGELPLAAAGSFLLGTPPVFQTMIDELGVRGYQPRVTHVTQPVQGALVLARRALEEARAG